MICPLPPLAVSGISTQVRTRSATASSGRAWFTSPATKATGFDISGQGTLPSPKISIANFGGSISAEVRANDDLVGCTVIRKRTLARFLDAVNFSSGVNPTADPSQFFPDESWFVEQKTLETFEVVEFELSSVFELMGVKLPYRQIIKNTCPWKYRGTECGYTGPYFDKDDKQTSISGSDYCTKRLDSCRARKTTLRTALSTSAVFRGHSCLLIASSSLVRRYLAPLCPVLPKTTRMKRVALSFLARVGSISSLKPETRQKTHRSVSLCTLTTLWLRRIKGMWWLCGTLTLTNPRHHQKRIWLAAKRRSCPGYYRHSQKLRRQH